MSHELIMFEDLKLLIVVYDVFANKSSTFYLQQPIFFMLPAW